MYVYKKQREREKESAPSLYGLECQERFISITFKYLVKRVIFAADYED